MIKNFKKSGRVITDLAMDGITCIFGRPCVGKTDVATSIYDAVYDMQHFEYPEHFNNGFCSFDNTGHTKCVILKDICYKHDMISDWSLTGRTDDTDRSMKKLLPFLTVPFDKCFPERWSSRDPDSLKAFCCIGYLVLNGTIKKGDILISDCSEARIHPMLQIEYAKLLVELYHTLGIQLVVISNSIDFWHALRMHAAKLELNDKIDLYEVVKSGLDEQAMTVRIKNDDFEKLFGMFCDTVVEPLEVMRNELDEYNINHYTRK